jgi:hypothetical protein
MKDDREYWEEVYSQSPLETIRKCEDAARQLISLNSILSAIYFGAISFNDVLQTDMNKLWLMGVFMLPIIAWCAGLYWATRVIIPDQQTVEDDIRRSYEASGERKFAQLKRSYGALLFSIIALIFAVGIYLCLLLSAPEPVSTLVPGGIYGRVPQS